MNLTNSKCLINATSLLSLYRKLFTMTRKFNPENFNFLAIFLKFLFRKQQLAAKISSFFDSSNMVSFRESPPLICHCAIVVPRLILRSGIEEIAKVERRMNEG